MTTKKPAFKIVEVNKQNGTVLVVLQKSILGSLSNQLKDTNDFRKASKIIRKLGFEFSKASDILYGEPAEGSGMERIVVQQDV